MTPEHSTISRTRRLSDLDTHRVVFRWVLNLLADRRAIEGKRVAIDATTLEANAAMRSMVRARHGRELRADSGWTGEGFWVGDADARGLGATGPQVQEAHVKPGMERSLGSRCTDREDEGRTHLAHKADSGPGYRGRAGGHAARR